MNYIITKNKEYFSKIGEYNFCNLENMVLPNKIALDTETTGLFAKDCDVFCIQIGTGINNYIIHMYDNNYEFKDVISYLENKILVLHNALFDLGFMYKYGFFPKEIRDTMLANKILYNGEFKYYETKKGKKWLPVKNDFGSVMESELNIKYDKTEQKNIHLVKLSQPTTIEYSFNDVDKLLLLHNVLEEKLTKIKSIETYNLHCRYIKALAYMEQCGLPISSEKWKEKMLIDLENQQKWKEKIKEYIYNNVPQYRNGQLDFFKNKKEITVSINSPLQMIPVFNALNIKTIDKEGKDSIKEDVISKTKHEFVDLWLNYQEANHRVTTFGESVYSKIINDRIYTNFNPMVDTARLSTRQGNINFLNFPKDKITRKCFVANEGNEMIVCDWSGQETVIAADLSGDEAMTKSVINNEDLHCAFAQIIFPEIKSLSDDEIIEKHSDKRQNAKAPRFCFQYGGNAFTLYVNEGIPLKRAQEIENGFKELHEGLYSWGTQVYEQSIKNGYIESVDGWKLKLPKFEKFMELKYKVEKITREQWTIYSEGKKETKRRIDFIENKKEFIPLYQKSVNYYNSQKKIVSNFYKLKSSYQRLCLNNPVQTRGAHQLKLAKSMLFDWIVENNLIWKIKICNSVHDEIILESEKQYSELAKQQLEKCMIEGGNYYLKTLKIKADAHIGISWGDAKN